MREPTQADLDYLEAHGLTRADRYPFSSPHIREWSRIDSDYYCFFFFSETTGLWSYKETHHQRTPQKCSAAVHIDNQKSIKNCVYEAFDAIDGLKDRVDERRTGVALVGNDSVGDTCAACGGIDSECLSHYNCSAEGGDEK